MSVSQSDNLLYYNPYTPGRPTVTQVDAIARGELRVCVASVSGLSACFQNRAVGPSMMVELGFCRSRGWCREANIGRGIGPNASRSVRLLHQLWCDALDVPYVQISRRGNHASVLVESDRVSPERIARWVARLGEAQRRMGMLVRAHGDVRPRLGTDGSMSAGGMLLPRAECLATELFRLFVDLTAAPE